jgi:hypothetical protein
VQDLLGRSHQSSPQNDPSGNDKQPEKKYDKGQIIKKNDFRRLKTSAFPPNRFEGIRKTADQKITTSIMLCSHH